MTCGEAVRWVPPDNLTYGAWTPFDFGTDKIHRCGKESA